MKCSLILQYASTLNLVGSGRNVVDYFFLLFCKHETLFFSIS